MSAAPREVTSLEIAVWIAEGKGMNAADRQYVTMLRKRVTACLYKLKVRGAVREVPLQGEYKGWALARQPSIRRFLEPREVGVNFGHDCFDNLVGDFPVEFHRNEREWIAPRKHPNLAARVIAHPSGAASFRLESGFRFAGVHYVVPLRPPSSPL